MERILKSLCILMVVFFIAVTFGSVTEQDVYAGGGKNYKVTVRNPTQHKVWLLRVFIWEGDTARTAEASVEIGPGVSYTWELGEKCPSYIIGSIIIGTRVTLMRIMDCHGVDHKSLSLPSKVECCWDISARVCQFAGHDTGGLEDYDYGFCKE